MKRFKWLMALAAVCMWPPRAAELVVDLVEQRRPRRNGRAAPARSAGKLVIDNESGSTWTCQFNPFNPSLVDRWRHVRLRSTSRSSSSTSSRAPSCGHAVAGDRRRSGRTASRRSPSRSATESTWSDGQPFSAADVAYTFNAMKSDKAIDLNALWTADGGPLTSVALKGTTRSCSPSTRRRSRTSTSSRTRRRSFRSTSGPRSTRASSTSTPTRARRHRSVPGVELRAAEHQVPAQPPLLAEHAGHPVPAIEEVDYPAFLSNTPATCSSPRARRSGAASTSRTSSRSTSRRTRPTATSGSRRS